MELPPNKQDVSAHIEFLKKYLADFAKNKELTDPNVLILSQHLDKLLNLYNKLN